MEQERPPPVVVPVASRRKWKFTSMLLSMIIALPAIYILLSLTMPLVLLVHPKIMNKIVFLNFLRTGSNLSNPESLKLERVHNFYLDVEPGVRIGVWHYRSPLVEDEEYTDDADYMQKHFASSPANIPVILYMHGNAFDRSLIMRRQLCDKLRRELKYHVFAFDYRGYGDSTGTPREGGLLKDARYIYDYLHGFDEGKRKFYLWGHSIGSAVACQLAAWASDDESKGLNGIVMEAPFVTIEQAIHTHWIALFFRWQPWFTPLTQRALRRTRLAFNTQEFMTHVNCPCVLLHADDDLTVPYQHSTMLMQAGMQAREKHRSEKKLLRFKIDMISYHRTGYGHRLIYQAEKLVPALRRLMFEEEL